VLRLGDFELLPWIYGTAGEPKICTLLAGRL
jgi:hypothetical protein